MAVSISIQAQPEAGTIGAFRHLSDVGNPSIPGSALYSAPVQEYTLRGSGENIWFGEDHFSFLWKEMEGDFIIQATLAFVGEGVNAHRKAGIMIRENLGSGSPHASCVIHGDGLTSLQFRREKGNDMEELTFDISGPDVLQLEKKGNVITMSVAHNGEMYLSRSMEIDLGEKLKAGLFICSHDDSVLEEATFHNVRVYHTAPDTFVPYRDYLGSLLEIMDVESGKRHALASSESGVSWEAPNWTRDGKALIFNARGLLYRYDLKHHEVNEIPTGFANRNNNDHVISFGGDWLAISNHSEKDGQSLIYTVPLEGGIPEKVTPNGPSYLHGWSADDKFLVYTAERKGVFNIFRIPVKGGKEEQLTFESSLDDGPEYSPDGKYIYFNSARTGTMQLWRMHPDGSEQTQLTFDEWNDWFPHISPDGKWIAYISFPPEVDAGDHPYYKRIYLRLMSVEDLKPSVIGYVYGGQGTINVPSWSPDSKSIAFISHGN